MDVEDVDQLVCRSMGALGAEGLVGELSEGRLVAGRLDHPVQFGLLPSLLRGLQLASMAAEFAGQHDRLLDFQRVIGCRGVRLQLA